jgi:septum site-determining protein MinD
MSARIITITSGKGGVGKTTTVANLGVALSRMGQRVVVIDSDIGLRNLDMILGLQNRIIYDIVDLVEGRCRARQALIRDRVVPELYLLPAAQSRDKTAVSPADMVRICEQLRNECDFILVDSPAGIELGFRNAIAPSDEFVLVTTPEYAALQDVDRVLGILESEGRDQTRLIINRMRPELSRRGDSLTVDQVLDVLGLDLLGIVPESEDVIAANVRGVPIAHAAETLAGQAYQNIARRLLGEQVAFIPLLKGRPKWWQRLGLGRRSAGNDGA